VRRPHKEDAQQGRPKGAGCCASANASPEEWTLEEGMARPYRRELRALGLKTDEVRELLRLEGLTR